MFEHYFTLYINDVWAKSQTLTRRSNVNRKIVSFAIKTLSSKICEYYLGIMMFKQSHKPLHVEMTRIVFNAMKTLSLAISSILEWFSTALIGVLIIKVLYTRKCGLVWSMSFRRIKVRWQCWNIFEYALENVKKARKARNACKEEFAAITKARDNTNSLKYRVWRPLLHMLPLPW